MGYLWGGLIVVGSTLSGGKGVGLGGKRGGSTLSGGAGGGLGGKCGDTAGVTLIGAWGSAFSCSVGNRVASQVRRWGGVGVVVGVWVAAKISSTCRIVSMVWAPKRAKVRMVQG